MKCANCYIPNRKIPDMDKTALYSLLSRLPKRVDVRLIGAEPTMRKDLPEIIQNVKRIGHRVTLVTNGLKLREEAYVSTLREAGLKFVSISMNGADQDSVYEKIDNGKYAEAKTQALENCLKKGLVVHNNMIVARDLNEHSVGRQIKLIVHLAKKWGLNFSENRMRAPIVRVKSVGAIGRHMKNVTLDMEELVELVAREFHVEKSVIYSQPVVTGANNLVSLEQTGSTPFRSVRKEASYFYSVPTEVGPISIKLIDWKVDEEGVPDSGNLNRGRITPDWKIAPFFEHVKQNEFGY